MISVAVSLMKHLLSFSTVICVHIQGGGEGRKIYILYTYENDDNYGLFFNLIDVTVEA